jgi:hypothetical protein
MRHVKKKKPIRQIIGAPPAYFLSSLGVKSLAHHLIENTCAERAALVVPPAQKISKSIFFQLVELASRIVQPKFKENAAEDLAMVGTVAANLLEELARTHKGPEIALAAARKNCWPVNLRLGVKAKAGKMVPTLEGIEKAKEYLVRIQLGRTPERVLKHLQNPQANPFARAAELLYSSLCDQRQKAAQSGRPCKNSWPDKLLSLDHPMTGANVDRWWAVAKRWMDEQWSSNRELFTPLIKHLRLNNPRFTPSIVKRQVIDDSLKKAFKALAARH